MPKYHFYTLSNSEQIYVQTKRSIVTKLFKRWFLRYAHVPPLFRIGLDEIIVRLTIAANMDLIAIGFSPKAHLPSFYNYSFLQTLIDNQLRKGRIDWNYISNDDGSSDVIYGLHQVLLSIISSNIEAKNIGEQFVFDLNNAKDEFSKGVTMSSTSLRYVTKSGIKRPLQHLSLKP